VSPWLITTLPWPIATMGLARVIGRTMAHPLAAAAATCVAGALAGACILFARFRHRSAS
jgi:bacteriorhodopsin